MRFQAVNRYVPDGLSMVLGGLPTLLFRLSTLGLILVFRGCTKYVPDRPVDPRAYFEFDD